MIDRTFEWRFVGRFAGIVLAGLGGTVLALYLVLPGGETAYYSDLIRSLAEADAVLPRAIAAALAAQFVVVSVAVALVAVITSHKIAGPLYKLGMELDRLWRRPDPGPIRFREGDQFQETAGTFNAMAVGLTEAFRSVDDACAKVEAAARETAPPGNRAELAEGIDRVGDSLRRFDI
ncbi:MAG: hypothetical protein IH611_03730 [Deltaproteobacteria bacterium]|nr:hypothetical protein [Deltaproteobacteria bacterium]